MVCPSHISILCGPVRYNGSGIASISLLGSHGASLTRQEIQAIQEAVADYISWTIAKQREWKGLTKHPLFAGRRHANTPACFSDVDLFPHPGVMSPTANPDYEWLHRQTWVHTVNIQPDSHRLTEQSTKDENG